MLCSGDLRQSFKALSMKKILRNQLNGLLHLLFVYRFRVYCSVWRGGFSSRWFVLLLHWTISVYGRVSAIQFFLPGIFRVLDVLEPIDFWLQEVDDNYHWATSNHWLFHRSNLTSNCRLHYRTSRQSHVHHRCKVIKGGKRWQAVKFHHE